MKTRSALKTIKINSLAALLILLSGALATATLGQTSQNSKAALSPEEQELIRARRANEEAQAEYYREQTNKLRQPPASPAPDKSFRQTVAENPASFVGVVGTILGALMVAMVGLTTLYFNNRNAIKAQMDTQFYEAMKRLGDEGSPTIRASAAGLLALMAQVHWRELSISKKWPHLKVVQLRPYFTTALDQLLTALLLENTYVVIDSVKDALQQLVPHGPASVAHRLHDANLSIQDELYSLMAQYFIITGRETSPVADEREEWEQLSNSTGYNIGHLRKLIMPGTTLTPSFENYLRIFRTQTAGDPGQLLSANHQNLRVTSSRLRANITLFCTVLGRFRPQNMPDASFRQSFLVDGRIAPGADLSGFDLSGSILTGLTLSGANMEGTNFSAAFLDVIMMSDGNLRGANLLGAKLEWARFRDIDMTDANLGYAKIDRWSTFERCNWWKANFYTTNPVPEVDSDLLGRFFERYGQDVPSDLSQVHISVRTFLESKKATGEPKAS